MKRYVLAFAVVACLATQAFSDEPGSTTGTDQGGTKPGASGAAVTFTKHVAPILWSQCTSCHHPGASAPFSLLTYNDARKRAKFIRDVTVSRRMPPWRAEPGYGPFENEPHLGDAEIATLTKWVEQGAPEGDPGDLGKAPTYPEPGSWALGTPDLILKMPCSFTVPASGPDVFRAFVIPIPVDEDKVVVGVEFHPMTPRVIYHAGFALDSKGAARKKDGQDGKPGYYNDEPGPGVEATGSLGGWGLTTRTRFLPEGIGMPLAKGSDLVLWFHYHPTGKEETDRSEIGIHFAKKPIQRFITNLGARTKDIAIPPGENRYKICCESAPFPCDVTAVTVGAHMHFVGREIYATAFLPDGKTLPLLGIKDWDFNWSERYEFVNPPRLPKGTVIKVEAYFDNSDQNARNPNKPPQLITWGKNITTNEMLGCGLEVVADSRADLDLIHEAQKKEARQQKLKDSFALSDVKGQRHTTSEWKGKKAIVVVFIATDCPVSNGYVPEYVRLAKKFGNDVAVYGIHPDPDVTADAGSKHADEYHIDFPILLDPMQTFTKQLAPKVVPTAAVILPDGSVAYQGRVDDKYEMDSKRKQEPTTHDLEDAIAAVLDGKAPAAAQTEAFGCPVPAPRQQELQSEKK